MWEDIRTPEGKLLFRINRDEKLVEGKEVKAEKKSPKRKRIRRHSLRQRSKSLMNKMNKDLCLPIRRQHLCSSFFACLFDRAKMASGKRHGQERAGFIYRNLCSLVTYKHILTCVCNEYSIKKLH